MNELLTAMSDEINRLRSSNNKIDVRLADSLFRIVYDTRANMARSARRRAEADIELFEEIFPFGPENS